MCADRLAYVRESRGESFESDESYDSFESDESYESFESFESESNDERLSENNSKCERRL